MKRAEIEGHLNVIGEHVGSMRDRDNARSALLALAEDAPPDPVEVVARMIYEQTNPNFPRLAWSDVRGDRESMRNDFMNIARAAIVAYEGVREGTA